MTTTVQAVAWTLIHFCWQAAAVAAVYRGMSMVTAQRSSNARYLLALGALLLMFAGSVGTFAYELQADSANLLLASTGRFAPYRISPVTTPATGSKLYANASETPSTALMQFKTSSLPLPALPLPVMRALVALWLIGVLALSLRSLGGWLLIQRLRSAAQIEAPPAVRESFRRIAASLNLARPVLLRVSSSISGPVTVGALRALVLLPLSAATSLSPDELEVVLAHELAHVRRADFLWNLVQTVVETLFFFHPAVWWVGSRIRYERELCCDDLALSVCPNPVAYAQALFNLELDRSRPGQLAMALDGHQPANTLRTRIARILGEPIAEAAHRGPISLAAAAAVLIVLILPVPQVLASLSPATHASTNMIAASSATAAPSPKPSAGQAVVVEPSVKVSANVSGPVITAANISVLAASDLRMITAQEPTPQTESTEPEQTSSESEGGKGDYIDRMKAAGYDVDLDKYIAMKVQNITPEYAAAMSQLGFGKLSADDLVACKVQGVTPEYITQLKQSGLKVDQVGDAISYKIFAVTPEFIAGMKTAGFSDLSSEQLLAMRVQGVTPEYARTIAQQYPGATPDDIVKTRIFNIDAAFIESARKHGFDKLSLDKLVQLRISGLLDDESNKK